MFRAKRKIRRDDEVCSGGIEKNQVRYKKNYDKKTKDQLLSKGDKVLVMLPTNNNKLWMQ